MAFSFELIKGVARGPRLGLLTTPHGQVMTPVFMPVGTQATVKAVTPTMLAEVGAKMILSNTYHLFLRPGADIVQQAGGLHRFMNWQGPILTDSGGFQVFSLSKLAKVSDEGVEFRSHIDGSKRFLSPEECVKIQEKLGSDVVTCLDQPVHPSADRALTEEALERTVKWASRCLATRTREDQAMFGIVQGGMFPDLREQCINALTILPFDGFAIGGLSLGEEKKLTYDLTQLCCELLPQQKPRYLMGVGAPLDIIEGVARGVDMFDSVLPTRLARHSAVFTSEGRINLKNQQYMRDFSPLDPQCDCYTCRSFSRAYLHHLFRAGEILAQILTTVHNIRFMTRLMEDIRQALREDRFDELKRRWENSSSWKELLP
ncbi:MAG TPA: tRNA guanosine(34) transglycosylase Tgt [Firmicutes bacterium]|nr:tRNA guanosine(34) transglycosylase Tgt [Bacillota bacterium]